MRASDDEAAKFWRSGGIRIRGTYLVRSAQMKNNTAVIRADLAKTSDIEVFASADRILLTARTSPPERPRAARLRPAQKA